MEKIRLSRKAADGLYETIGRFPPECGGVLGADESGVITEFYFDENGLSTENGYAPNVQDINDMLTNDWMPRGIYMVGIVHSHANGVPVPSCGDISYGIRILQALDTVDQFYIPIMTKNDGGADLTWFGIYPDPERKYVCRQIEYEVIEQ